MDIKVKPFLFCALALLLSSCSTTVTSLKIDQVKQLPAEYGFLLLGIETNSNLKELYISGPQNIKFSSADIKKGTNYLLVDLEAGIYTLEKIKLDNYWRLEIEDSENWVIEISPGNISYVGHMEIKRLSGWYANNHLELVNRSSEAIEFLEKNYPNIYSNRRLSYGGPGEDTFFEFFQSLEGATNE